MVQSLTYLKSSEGFRQESDMINLTLSERCISVTPVKRGDRQVMRSGLTVVVGELSEQFSSPKL